MQLLCLRPEYTMNPPVEYHIYDSYGDYNPGTGTYDTYQTSFYENTSHTHIQPMSARDGSKWNHHYRRSPTRMAMGQLIKVPSSESESSSSFPRPSAPSASRNPLLPLYSHSTFPVLVAESAKKVAVNP